MSDDLTRSSDMAFGERTVANMTLDELVRFQIPMPEDLILELSEKVETAVQDALSESETEFANRQVDLQTDAVESALDHCCWVLSQDDEVKHGAALEILRAIGPREVPV